jgi:anti-anti-sigma factor
LQQTDDDQRVETFDLMAKLVGSGHMEIKIVGDVGIAIFVKRLDAYTSRDAEAALKDLIEKGVRRIVCDLSQTEYIASAGLRLLLSVAKNLQRLGGQLVLSSLGPFAKEVFDTAGFTQLFKIFNSTEEALTNLRH